MGVGNVWIRRHADRHGVSLIGNVGDRQRRLVGTEADLVSRVTGIRTVVDDALRVVRITGAASARGDVGETAGKGRLLWILNVDHVQPAAAGLAATASTDNKRKC